VGEELAPGQDESDAGAIDALYNAVLNTKTLQQLRPEILAQTKDCKMGLHYAGSEKAFMQDVGFKGQMANLASMMHRFLEPLRPEVIDAHFSQSKTCLAMGGEWLAPHRAMADARMAQDTGQRFVEKLRCHDAALLKQPPPVSRLPVKRAHGRR
jgi:hypothetical protein